MKEKKMFLEKKFYEFIQNNSGGNYKISKEEKISKHILIEAFNSYEANALALQYTEIYFDGVDCQHDCECCGDRWKRVRESDVIDSSIEEYKKNLKKRFLENDTDFFCILHYGSDDLEIVEV